MKTATFEYYVDAYDDMLEAERDIRVYRLSEPFSWRQCEDDEPFETDFVLTVAGHSSHYFEDFVIALPSNLQGHFLLFATEPSYMLKDTQDADSLLREMGYTPVYEDIPDPTVFGW